MKRLSLALAALWAGALGGCIPLPTINRQPEPVHNAIAWRSCSALGHPTMLSELSAPQDPLHNPRQALDLRDDLLETWGDTVRSSYLPRITQGRHNADRLLSAADANYWAERWRAEGTESYFMQQAATHAQATPAQRCLRQVQAGTAKTEADLARRSACRELSEVQRADLLRQGLAWRAQWARPAAHPPLNEPSRCP